MKGSICGSEVSVSYSQSVDCLYISLSLKPFNILVSLSKLESNSHCSVLVGLMNRFEQDLIIRIASVTIKLVN